MRLPDLAHPIVQAPMAGGPSTPALAAAVSDAGGLGFLAGGYQTPDQLDRVIRDTRALTAAPFGVNLFVPDDPVPGADAAVARYREALAPVAERFGVTLPTVKHSDDHYPGKLAVILDQVPAVASFTFGCPSIDDLTALRVRGIATVVTVTSADEAALAVAAGADALCVQGAEAGGHRGTFDATTEPNDLTTLDVLASVREVADVPIMAAGGVRDAADVQALVDAGAAAVQVGTLFLLADEAGTSPAHRRGVQEFASRDTVRTRAFSGRMARGIRNAFIDAYDDLAPAIYPEVNALTKAIRTSAADDPEVINLWAGTGFAAATPGPAAEIVRRLVEGVS